jgi:hypothetical protein
MAALDAMEGGRTRRARSTSARPRAKERSRAEVDQLIAGIEHIIAEQQPSRDVDPSVASVMGLTAE